jgi:hypothetical protein
MAFNQSDPDESVQPLSQRNGVARKPDRLKFLTGIALTLLGCIAILDGLSQLTHTKLGLTFDTAIVLGVLVFTLAATRMTWANRPRRHY